MMTAQLIQCLNTWTVDGYTVKFKNFAPYITDSNGVVVYKPADEDGESINHILLDLDNDGQSDPEGQATFDKVQELYKEVLLDGVRDKHYGHAFMSLDYDYGITTEITFGLLSYKHSKTYEEVIEMYNNRPYENFVISGAFGKGFLDKAIADLGSENVAMLNITRHPSVVKLLHRKDEAYYIKNAPKYTENFDNAKMVNSVCICASLTRLENVTTIPFERIMSNRGFTFLGTEIPIPSIHQQYNRWLTQWEFENVIPANNTTAEEVDEFNAQLSNTADAFNSDPTYDPRYPTNFFEPCEYEPMTVSEILEK
jgi:hypothetical protein